MSAYYNEIDPKAAAWLRELIKQGHIADGIVDERSIEDVRPQDLNGFIQCHFFAGIGVWSYSLRRAGWRDDMPIWTGSCPCQPFSAAGKGGGFSDERHLWPAFFHLIECKRPLVVVGEQVGKKNGLAWLDLVQTDLEGTDYTFGALGYCSAGVGSPNIRERLCWVAYSELFGRERFAEQYATGILGTMDGERGSRESISSHGASTCGLANGVGFGYERLQREGDTRLDWGKNDQRAPSGFEPSNMLGGLAYSEYTERGSLGVNRKNGCNGQNLGREEAYGVAGTCREVRRVGVSGGSRLERYAGHVDNGAGRQGTVGPIAAPSVSSGLADTSNDSRFGSFARATIGFDAQGVRTMQATPGPPGPTNGFWRDVDWLFCRDGKWRPVEPGTFPLAHGAACRVGLLRGYGNAINAEAATENIKALMEVLGICQAN